MDDMTLFDDEPMSHVFDKKYRGYGAHTHSESIVVLSVLKLYDQGEVSMSKHDIDVADMQCWVFRMAQDKWKKTPEECAKLFQDNDIFGFISSCYEILHLSSYECALDDVEEMLKNRGIFIC